MTLDRQRLTIAVNPEGVSAPMIRVAIGDDVRELCPGDRHVFELDSATPAPEPQTTG